MWVVMEGGEGISFNSPIFQRGLWLEAQASSHLSFNRRQIKYVAGVAKCFFLSSIWAFKNVNQIIFTQSQIKIKTVCSDVHEFAED